MKRWFKNYQDTMRRTRIVSTAGAVVAVTAAILDLYGLFRAVAQVEVSVIEQSDVAWSVGRSMLLLFGVIAVFTLRIILLSFSRTSYYIVAASWLAALTTALVYLWLTNPFVPATPDCTSSEGKICFGIYDISTSFGWMRLVGVLYFPLSLLRALATWLWAGFRHQYK